MPVQIQLRHDTAANWTSADPTLALGEVGIETDTDKMKFGDGATAWTGLSYAGGGSTPGLPAVLGVDNDAAGADIIGVDRLEAATAVPAAIEDPGTSTGGSAEVPTADGAGSWAWAAPGAAALNPGTLPEIASPSTPSSGNVYLYAKADGRVYSKDDAGTEFGPFDAAGGGSLYAIDETFPGSSLPAGWTFTGSGSATVSGGKVAVNMTAAADRLMFAHSFGTGNHIIRANLKNYSGTRGGMCGLAVFDSAGQGFAVSPYNDGNTYMWTANGTAYQYSGTNTLFGSSPSLTDIWWELQITGGKVLGAAYSTDGGSTWTSVVNGLNSAFTFDKVGICRLFSVTESMDLYELTCTEP